MSLEPPPSVVNLVKDDPQANRIWTKWLSVFRDYSSRSIRHLNPDTVLYNDIIVTGLELSKGANSPTLTTFRDTIQQNAFAGTGAIDQAYATYHVLHDFRAASIPTIHIHWAHNIASGSYTPDTAAVKWNIACMWANGYGSQSFATEIETSTVQTAGAQYIHHITDDDDMALSGLTTIEPDGLILFRIWRDPADAADTFEFDAFLLQVDLHYEIGQTATLERNRPFTSAGF